MKLLFVDDEVRVLEALERMMFELEPDWQTAFASSAEQAFVELAKDACDVVVSDLHMSGVDGVALLTRVRELYPRSMRIVLSGHSDEQVALRMVPIAHQFLAKPCGAETLHQIIARTQQLTRMLGDRKLQAMVGQVGSLPSAPHIQQELLQLLARDHATAADVAQVLKQDPSMTAKLLQLTGSAFFNTPASLIDVETAIVRLGFRTLRTLVQSWSPLETTQRSSDALATSVEALQRRSLAIARTASGMARLPEDAAVAYVAGLLCDVGQLVLASSAPERLYVTQAEAVQAGVPAHVAEKATWGGATHAEIGAFLLGLWGLPFQVVEAVANHHAPERHPAEQVGLAHLVWLAACIVDGEEPAADALHRCGAEELYATTRLAFERTAPPSPRDG